MVLPFVRDLFADVENLPAFSRVASHLKERHGADCVCLDLLPTAKALLLVLLQRAAAAPAHRVVVRQSRRGRHGPGAAGFL